MWCPQRKTVRPSVEFHRGRHGAETGGIGKIYDVLKTNFWAAVSILSENIIARLKLQPIDPAGKPLSLSSSLEASRPTTAPYLTHHPQDDPQKQYARRARVCASQPHPRHRDDSYPAPRTSTASPRLQSRKNRFRPAQGNIITARIPPRSISSSSRGADPYSPRALFRWNGRAEKNLEWFEKCHFSAKARDPRNPVPSSSKIGLQERGGRRPSSLWRGGSCARAPPISTTSALVRHRATKRALKNVRVFNFKGNASAGHGKKMLPSLFDKTGIIQDTNNVRGFCKSRFRFPDAARSEFPVNKPNQCRKRHGNAQDEK